MGRKTYSLIIGGQGRIVDIEEFLASAGCLGLSEQEAIRAMRPGEELPIIGDQRIRCLGEVLADYPLAKAASAQETPGGFVREVRERQEVREGRESLTAEIEGWDVIMTRELRAYSPWTLTFAQVGEDRIRLPILSLHPKSTEQLRALAKALPAALETVCSLLEAEGMTDLRSEGEASLDLMRQAMQNLLLGHGDIP